MTHPVVTDPEIDAALGMMIALGFHAVRDDAVNVLEEAAAVRGNAAEPLLVDHETALHERQAALTVTRERQDREQVRMARNAALEEAAKEAKADWTPAYGPHDARMEWFAETQRSSIATRIYALKSTNRSSDDGR